VIKINYFDERELLVNKEIKAKSSLDQKKKKSPYSNGPIKVFKRKWSLLSKDIPLEMF